MRFPYGICNSLRSSYRLTLGVALLRRTAVLALCGSQKEDVPFRLEAFPSPKGTFSILLRGAKKQCNATCRLTLGVALLRRTAVLALRGGQKEVPFRLEALPSPKVRFLYPSSRG